MNLECDIVLPDINNLDIDKVLSFNYTDTYVKLYDFAHDKCDYIHGKANSNGTISTNNMVLGIDEYLHGERKDNEVEFVAFKKFYQRICKQTGCQYKEWAEEIEHDGILEKLNLREEFREKMHFDDFVNQNFLYIFGHSLDVTDKDVLKTLILNDNVYTTIYYLEKFDKNGNGDNGRGDLEQKVSNLVKVIGQDELIRRTGGNTKTIEFKLQTK